MQKKIHFENLDGLRFFCFLSVFFYHSFFTESTAMKESPLYQFVKVGIFNNGNLGVNFFFVLSGFLITYLLIAEKQMNGQIDLKRFWLRRILRIWPLFYFCVFFGFFIFPALKQAFGQTPNENASIGYYLTFLNNFDFIKKGLPDSSVLGVLWSVAIEEQFYLIWPVILFLLPVRKYWLAFTTVIVASLIFRALNDKVILHEHHTLSCIGDMATGAFGAWLAATQSRFRERIAQLSRLEIAAIYTTFIAIYFFRDEVLFSTHSIRIFERLLIAIVMLFIILEQNYAQNSFFKLRNYPRISRLGVISYGLYCYHFIGILITVTLTKKLHFNSHLWQVLISDTFFALVLSIIIASLSYRYFETPFLKLKKRFAYIIK